MRRATWILLLALFACGRTEPLDPRQPVEVEPGDAGPADAGKPDAGPPDAGPPDAGPPDAGPPDAGPPDAGFDAGFPVVACDPLNPCPSGFICQDGVCVLNGGQGQLQITLSWNHTPRHPEDLDLHVLEPNAFGGSCEIYYGQTNAPGNPSPCGAVGSLDLDANSACNGVPPPLGLGQDTENIIYPAGRPAPSGHYVVRVDYYANCDGANEVPFTVVLRQGSQTTLYPGVFHAGDADNGGAQSGHTIVQFDIP